MKKSTRKTIIFLLLFVLLISTLSLCACGPAEATDLEYELSKDETYYIVSGIGNEQRTSFTIPSTYNGKPVKEIDDMAFRRCFQLTDIVIPASVTKIHNDAFCECSSLKRIVIPASVTVIGLSAFSRCNNLEEIIVKRGNPGYSSAGNCLIATGSKTLMVCCKNSVIPTDGSVTSIESGAFYACNGLTSIVIPSSVIWISRGAFSVCRNLESITVAEGNTVYHSAGNCLIETARKTLIVGCKNSVIPTDGSVTSIDDRAFCDCDLISIAIPDSVTSIGFSAFSGCRSLASVTFGENSQLNSIDFFAFSGCSSLTSIVIPDSVTSIGNSAFDDCSSLTNIAIPASVTSIGDYAFDGCSSLTIYCEAESQPSGWDSHWNLSKCPVVWGYTK